MTSERAAADELDPVGVLGDLPGPLWGSLLRALRRAVDRLPRADLPAGLRPYAGWTPDSLAAPRPRRAVARALAEDVRLRVEIGQAMGDRSALDAADRLDTARLVEQHGEEAAVVALVAGGRWRDLAVVAAAAAERLASEDRSVSEMPAERPRAGEAARRRLSSALADARDERDTQRRRADAADERARREKTTRRELEEEVARLQQRVEELDERLLEDRRRHQKRLGRLQRRLAEAEARVRVDQSRGARVVHDLERLAGELRAALDPDEASEGGPPPPAASSEVGVARVPRSLPAADSGRPCRLPPGIAADGAAAVEALLQVPGLEVVLDGYNVTMDARGRPHTSLADQRQWLVKHAGGVVARFGRRLTVVFDGTEERPAPAPAARGVRVVFSTGEEIADERVGHIVGQLDPSVPVLVVSSDGEVRCAAEDTGANVASSRAFLEATGA